MNLAQNLAVLKILKPSDLLKGHKLQAELKYTEREE